MAFRYDPNRPWFWLNGELHPFEMAEEGYTVPQWATSAAGDERSDFRVADMEGADAPLIREKTVAMLGFDPDLKRVNPDGSVSIMNPQTGQYEQAVAAGESGALMPISMAQEQQLPIYQMAMEPKDTGTLGQVLDIADPLMKMYAIASGANMLGNGLNTLGLGTTPSMPTAPAAVAAPAVDAGVQTFPLAAQEFPVGVELGAGGPGSAARNVPGLVDMALPAAAAGPVMPPASAVVPAAAAAAGVAGGGATGTEWLDSGEDPMGGPLTLPGEMSIWDKVLAGIKTFSGAAGTANSLLGNGGLLSSLYNIGTGLYGMNQADDMMDFAEELRKQSDPFASERDYYKGKLRSLYDNPASLVETPGYKAGEQAVTRSMAANGYLGSGNMMTELFDYGGKVFDSQAARLAQLAGAGATPGAGGATVANTMDSSNAAMVSALNRIGYGLKGGF